MIPHVVLFISDNSHLFHSIFDDCILVVTLPLISTLFFIAIKGSKKVEVIENSDPLSEN